MADKIPSDVVSELQAGREAHSCTVPIEMEQLVQSLIPRPLTSVIPSDEGEDDNLDINAPHSQTPKV